MAFIYVIDNLIDAISLHSVSSEDGVFLKENIYNKRPSFPFRFAVQSGSDGKSDQWIKVELGSGGLVTFAGLFNHNITDPNDYPGSPSSVSIEANNADFLPGTGASAYQLAMDWHLENMGKKLNQMYSWWAFFIDDPSNPYCVEIGDAVFGVWEKFNKAKVQPGRDDGPIFAKTQTITRYRQDWDVKLAEGEHFSIRIVTLNSDLSQEDEVQTWLKRVQNNGGKFIFIPDDAYCNRCYYVRVINIANYATREIYGPEGEMREWHFELETLTMGISLL